MSELEFTIQVETSVDVLPVRYRPVNGDTSNIDLNLHGGYPLLFSINLQDKFLAQRGGVYLGKQYPLKAKIGGQFLYLHQVSGTEYSVGTIPSDKSLSLTLLHPSINWGQLTDQYHFDNFAVGSKFTAVKLTRPVQSVNRLVYSVAENPQALPPSSTRDPFGIRIQSTTDVIRILTYKVNGDVAQLAYIKATEISADFINQEIYTAQLFYAEGFTGTFVVGNSYNIYIYDIAGNKKYLTFLRPGDTNSDIYQLSDSPSSTSISFVPSRTGNWDEFIFAASNFSNLQLPHPGGNGLFALFTFVRNLSGTPVVVNPPSTSPPPPLNPLINGVSRPLRLVPPTVLEAVEAVDPTVVARPLRFVQSPAVTDPVSFNYWPLIIIFIIVFLLALITAVIIVINW